MWQPPFNSNLYRFKETDLNAIQTAANAIHLQNLKLYETLPPLKQFAADLFAANMTQTAGLVQNSATLTQNHFPQYLRTSTTTNSASPLPYTTQWSTAAMGHNSNNRHLLLPATLTAAAPNNTDATATLTMPNTYIANNPEITAAAHTLPTLSLNSNNFLPPPPPPPAPPTALSTLAVSTQIPSSTTTSNYSGVDILSPWDLYIMSEFFMGITATRFSNPSLAQTLPFKEGLLALNSISNFFNKFLTDPLKRSLFSPQQLNLFQQYLTMEQQELQKYNPNLIPIKTSSISDTTNAYVNNSFHLNHSKMVNATMTPDLNISSLSSSATSSLKSKRSPDSFSSNHLSHFNRKRRDDLKDLFMNNKSDSFVSSSKAKGEKQLDGSTSAVASDDDLLPPPKKKWIRHYLKDDANSNNKNNNNNNNTSFMLLTNSTTTKLLKTSSSSPSPTSMVIDEEPMEEVKNIETETTLANDNNNATTTNTTTFTLIGKNGEIIGNAAASKQMLLANGIRIAAPAATIGHVQQAQHVTLSKAINIPHNNKTIPIITGFPYQLTPPSSSSSQQINSSSTAAGTTSNVILTNRHKPFIPLTPPPMSSRKFVEPSQSRIRSYSLSHKFSANNNNSSNNHLHVQNNNNNNNSMMVDEIPPTQQHNIFGTNSSSTSPPRHMSSSLGATGSGSHYMHMINAAASGSQQTGGAGSGTNHVTHATPRRRTISSTSNGAGTREVHNKLEKNRRAHLKECYEALKNQLSLKDEDRRKTSNLAILGEALKCVQSYQKRNQELEAEFEHLANDKINLQKKILSLKRELGPKYEQHFSGILPDIEINSIPSERETINDTHSLSSGRGSTLYSSSSSLSSGGSNGSSSNGGSGSNTMSSPVGAGLQTAMPTTISPVINKINHNNSVNSTSPINSNSNNLNNNNNNIVIQQQHRKNPTITTTIQAVAIPTSHQQQQLGNGGGGGAGSPPAGSPTALVTFGSSLPLSLTAKNISATAVTRGSPTPSTPSPSPSSSSGVSSSSSLISSSPPINGVISNGRNVTVNIPNGLKLQAAAGATVGVGSGINGVGSNVGSMIIGGNNSPISSSAAATILATSAPANNAVLGNHQTQQHNGRKKSLSLSNCNNNNIINHNNNMVMETKSLLNHHNNHQQQQQLANEDGEQPAKFLKVFNASTTATTTINGHHTHQQTQQQTEVKNHTQKLILTSNGGILAGNMNGGGATIIGGVGGGGGIVNNNNNNNNLIGGSCITNKSNANGVSSNASTTTNELCRLPGGAELNILPSNGLKISSGIGIGSVTGPVATAFYHSNGKITLVNGPPPTSTQHQYHHPHTPHHHHHHHQQQHPPSSPLPNSTTTITSNGTTTLTNGILLKDANSVTTTPLLVSSASSTSTATSVNGLHFAGNFAQLLAAANNTSLTTTNSGSNNNNGSVASTTTASIVPMATNFQNITESKTKSNSKTSMSTTWRSGTATTN